MLYKRIISICFLVPWIISALFFLSLVQFSIFLFVICFICAWEWGNLMKFSVNVHYVWMVSMLIILFNMMMVMLNQKYSYFNYGIGFFVVYGIIILCWLIIFLFTLFYPNSSIFWGKFKILRFCFGIVIIVPFFFGVLTLYQLYYNNIFFKEYWLLYILGLVWINDSGAYIIGKMLGKYKLLKNVSPQKTWEGCIGGVLLSVLAAWFLSNNIAINFGNFYMIFFLFVGTIIFAVIGDLAESMFKREAGIKDISNLIPGHGGLLDRIDSLMFSIPFFTFFILLFLRVNGIKV